MYINVDHAIMPYTLPDLPCLRTTNRQATHQREGNINGADLTSKPEELTLRGKGHLHEEAHTDPRTRPATRGVFPHHVPLNLEPFVNQHTMTLCEGFLNIGMLG